MPGQWRYKFLSTLHPCHAGALGLRIPGVVGSRQRKPPDNPMKEIKYGQCGESATLISVSHRPRLNPSGNFASWQRYMVALRAHGILNELDPYYIFNDGDVTKGWSIEFLHFAYMMWIHGCELVCAF